MESGQTPAKMPAPCQNIESETETGKDRDQSQDYACSITEPNLISQQRSHLQSLHNSH